MQEQPGEFGDKAGVRGRRRGAGGAAGTGEGGGGDTGGAKGGSIGDGGGDGHAARTLRPPATQPVPEYQVHCGTSFGQIADVDTDVRDDHSVPGDGPITQRPPPTVRKYRYELSVCRYTERPCELSDGSSVYVPW